MRCYNINCFYLAGIHSGIQSGHSQKELSVKYLIRRDHPQSEKAEESLKEYLEHHKTVVVLNGGMYGDLLKVEKFLGRPENTDYAWAPFRESEYAMNGMLTNIAVVLPWHIYAYKGQISELLAGDQSRAAQMHVAPGQSLVLAMGRLSLVVITDHEFGKAGTYHYSPYEIELMQLIGGMKLMG